MVKSLQLLDGSSFNRPLAHSGRGSRQRDQEIEANARTA
jgi:hypothetical protein